MPLCTILAMHSGMTDTTSSSTTASDWRQHLVQDSAGIARILEQTKRVAVLGIKTAETGEPAYYVAEYARHAGMEIIPVPVYFPDVVEILGAPVVRTVAAAAGPVDMVNVFRRANKIDAHVDDILTAKPKCVWFQLGIRNDAAAETFARAGIDVVQDRCLLVELRKVGR